MKILGIVVGLLVSVHAGNEIIHMCEGFAPENNRSIPVAARGFMQVGGISEQEFNDALNRLESLFAADVAEKGAELVVNKYWTSSEVNAYADRDGNRWMLEMHGGLARHPMMTADGYILVGCHELGHHIGGAPFFSWFGENMSNEGQSDYYATLKCFRRLFTLEENQAWAAATTVHPLIESECAERFGSDEAEVLSCKRAASAGIVLGNVLADLGQDVAPTLGQIDPRKVARTSDSHPDAQCRLDTYFNGAVCTKSVKEKNSDTDALAGSCEKVNGYDYGFRPRCWYAPAVPDQEFEQLELPFLTKR